jgi:replicative DNA helicase
VNHDIVTEMTVLGGIFLTNEAISDVSEIVRPEDFGSERHGRIFATMQALAAKGEPIDVITLSDELQRANALDECGGLAYLSSLDATVPATGNIGRYAKIVRAKGLQREAAALANAIARVANDDSLESATLVARVEELALQFGAKRAASGRTTTIAPIVRRVFSEIERRSDHATDVTGLPSGFRALDMLTCGFHEGDLVVIAGRPSMGKTAIVMNAAAHVAVELQRPALVFSLEMGEDSLVERLFAADASVDGQRLRTGRLEEADWTRLARSADRLFQSRFIIDDTPNLSVAEMRARARKVRQAHPGLALVAVDYMQLMRGTGSKGANREQEVSEISRGLKAMARELRVPVIALSQLNRGVEQRTDKRPMMSDLRESGAIEQDADVIAFVYRDEVYSKESPDKGTAEIIIAKQRNGPIGVTRLAFHHAWTRFDDIEEREQADADSRTVAWNA